MTDREPDIAEEWLAALSDSLGLFARLVQHPRVTAAWPTASNLDGYTVGGIAGHVLSLITGLQLRIESGPSGLQPIPYVDWYRLALSSDARHVALMEIGEALAAEGPAQLAASIDAASENLVQCLRHSRRDLVVPLASIPGAGVRLDDFVRTRFVEITVHAADIATSAGLPTPSFPATAWALAAQAIAETSGGDGDQGALLGQAITDADLVLAVSRPNRTIQDDNAEGDPRS